MSALTELIKLSNPYGKIPNGIPAHYVKYCMSIHRQERKARDEAKLAKGGLYDNQS